MSFSDFPIPKDWPIYLHNTKVHEYLTMYMKHFNLENHIRFNTTVLNISRAEDFEVTGRWIVDYCSSRKGGDSNYDSKCTEVFDAVMIATGHHWKQRWPDFKGMDTFKGKQIHSKSYKNHRGYEDKKVLIVGKSTVYLIYFETTCFSGRGILGSFYSRNAFIHSTFRCEANVFVL